MTMVATIMAIATSPMSTITKALFPRDEVSTVTEGSAWTTSVWTGFALAADAWNASFLGAAWDGYGWYGTDRRVSEVAQSVLASERKAGPRM